MQKDSKFFEDLAKMASSAGNTFMEMKREVESMSAQQMEKMLHKMDLVTREDFNLVREMAVKARTEQEKLEKRVAELEKKLGVSKPAAKKKAAPAPKPATTKKLVRKTTSAKKAGTTRKTTKKS